MQCNDMLKQINDMTSALDRLDGELERAEKGLKFKRTAKVKTAMANARKAVGKATKALNKGSIPIELCVELGAAFDAVEKQVHDELRALEKHCDSLSWDGQAAEKERCMKEWRKAVYLKAIKGTEETFMNGLKKFVWKQLLSEYSPKLKKTKVALKKAQKELAA